ncbi:MAG TPA: ubiquitin-like domain-containing protein, partial [Clostridia bacterium]|nr:ubiquitin-like domain-containing protein [Clostridia bacterium]
MKKGKYAKLFALVRYPVMLIGVTVMSIALASGIFASNINTVTICYNGTLIDVTTTGRTVKEALSVAGINLTEDDYINYDIDTSLSGVDFIEIETPITLTVNVEGREVMIKSRQSTVSEVLEQNDIELTARDLVIGAELDEITENGMNLSIVRIQEEYDIENITIEYETEYVPSNYLLKGQTKVLTPGREGVRTLVYRVIKE